MISRRDFVKRTGLIAAGIYAAHRVPLCFAQAQKRFARSPAVNAGVKIPTDWLDPLREKDRGKPDLGAVPAGVSPWTVGVNGRIPVFPQNR